MNEWQPIETCPQDTPVLVVANNVVQHAVVSIVDGYWGSVMEGDIWDDFHPTHWMPLPYPPSDSNATTVKKK